MFTINDKFMSNEINKFYELNDNFHENQKKERDKKCDSIGIWKW